MNHEDVGKNSQVVAEKAIRKKYVLITIGQNYSYLNESISMASMAEPRRQAVDYGASPLEAQNTDYGIPPSCLT